MGILTDPSVNDEMLVNLFAFALDFPVAEKQGLLEVADLAVCADRLIDTLEFHALEREVLPFDRVVEAPRAVRLRRLTPCQRPYSRAVTPHASGRGDR